MGKWWNDNVKPTWNFGAETLETIRKGSKGDTVKRWQRIIGVTDDGSFGPNTESKTKDWQRAKSLTADGVVGPKTWAAAQPAITPPLAAPLTYADIPLIAPNVRPEVKQKVSDPSAKKELPPEPKVIAKRDNKLPVMSHPTIRIGDQGAAVSEWQRVVGIVPADGKFGPNTQRVTKQFQSKAGITADGVVGPQTWAAAHTSAGKPVKVVDSTKKLPPSVSDIRNQAKVTKAPNESETVVRRKRSGIPAWLYALGAAVGLGGIAAAATMGKDK